jgi:ribosomal protein L37AE/L43A
MKPLVKLFLEPFFEEFSSEVSEQNQDRKSLKVNDLLTTDVQEEITMSDRDPEMFKRYLKAIIEEKKEECDIQAYYENANGNKTMVNVYEFLTDLVGEVSFIKPNRGEKSRNVPILTTKQKRVQDRTKSVQHRPRIDPAVEIDEVQKIELTDTGITFCPNCGTFMRPKLTNIGTSVYFCKDCNKAFAPKSK